MADGQRRTTTTTIDDVSSIDDQLGRTIIARKIEIKLILS
jgi:hypothetical protein